MIRFKCRCGELLEMDDEYAGRKVKCPDCSRLMKVPAPGTKPARKRPPEGVEESVVEVRPEPSRSFPVIFLGGTILCLAVAILASVVVLSRRGGRGAPEAEREIEQGKGDAAKEGAGAAKATEEKPTRDRGADAPGLDLDAEAKKRQEEKELRDKLLARLKKRTTSNDGPQKEPGTPPDRPTEVPGAEELSEKTILALLQDFAVPIPRGSDRIVVDGSDLQVSNVSALAGTACACLFLPKGKHTVQFAPGGAPSARENPTFFSGVYLALRNVFSNKEGALDIRLLAEKVMVYRESPETPLIPHLCGNYYAQGKHLDAAGRSYRRALAMCPTFAVSHLNLAHVYAEAGDKERARLELGLARRFNVGDVFGISRAIADLAGSAGLAPVVGVIAVPLAEYTGETDMSEENQRLVAFAVSLCKYFPAQADRAKMLNNIGVHFVRAGRFELGLREFAHAVQALDPDLRQPGSKEAALKIYDNILRCCESKGWMEREIYRIIVDELKRTQ